MFVEVLLVSLLAGLATGLGGILAVSFKRAYKKFLGFGLGFSGGVMIVIAFIGLFFKALKFGSYETAVISFLAGAFVMFLLDAFIPHQYIFRECSGKGKKACMMRVGILVALGITIHNFPEGAAVGIGYSAIPALGIVLALAIAIHNIPEGLAIAVPLRASGMKKGKVVMLTLFSGLAEPFGALVALLFLVSIPGILPVALAFTGGVMAHLTMDELMPVAKKYGNPELVSIGIILGMALTLLMESAV